MGMMDTLMDMRALTPEAEEKLRAVSAVDFKWQVFDALSSPATTVIDMKAAVYIIANLLVQMEERLKAIGVPLAVSPIRAASNDVLAAEIARLELALHDNRCHPDYEYHTCGTTQGWENTGNGILRRKKVKQS